MATAFEIQSNLSSGDYITKKRAATNYEYFQKKIRKNQNKSIPIVSNYNGKVYFRKECDICKENDGKKTNYYLANSRSYDELLSLSKGKFLQRKNNIFEPVNNTDLCCECPGQDPQTCQTFMPAVSGKLYEGNYIGIKDPYYRYNMGHLLEKEELISILVGLNMKEEDKSTNYYKLCNNNLYRNLVMDDKINANTYRNNKYPGYKSNINQMRFPNRLVINNPK